MTAHNSSTVSPPAPQPAPFTLETLEQSAARSKSVAWCLILGLPLLGLLLALVAQLPFFAALMAGCFLLGTLVASARAITTFAGNTLRLLVSARLTVVLVLGAVLFCVTGSAWTAVVSAVLLWLTADRLLGRRALYDLWKANRSDRP